MSRILVIGEHDGQHIQQSTARCLNCAQQIEATGADVVIFAAREFDVSNAHILSFGQDRIFTIIRSDPLTQLVIFGLKYLQFVGHLKTLAVSALHTRLCR